MTTTGDSELDIFAERLKALASPLAAPSEGFAAGVMARIRTAERARRIRRRFLAGALPALAAALAIAVVLPQGEAASRRLQQGEAASSRLQQEKSPSSRFEIASAPSPSRPTHQLYGMAFAGDIDGILRTQGEDGSWRLAHLTRFNAAALERSVAAAPTPAARKAYMRAMRWMRLNGVVPLTRAEFEREAAHARTWRG